MEEEVRDSVSRRRVLKRAGVGAVIVWSAPVLTSLGSSAHAASPVDAVACTDCGTDVCGDQGTCSGTCPCSPLLDGTCRCWGPAHGGCDDFFGRCDPAGPNRGDDDCPSGSSCVPTCCYSGGKTGICAPPCGAASAVGSSVGGPRTDGK